jgi:hypothetical protein
VIFHIFSFWKRKEEFRTPDVEYEFQFSFGNPVLDHVLTVKYCIGNRRMQEHDIGESPAKGNSVSSTAMIVIVCSAIAGMALTAAIIVYVEQTRWRKGNGREERK